MRAEWTRWCKRSGFEVDGDDAVVTLADERRQRVRVQDEGEAGLLLRAIVARGATVDNLKTPALVAWRRNRTTKLVGFGMDTKGRLVGECWVPKAGLSEPEFVLYMRTIAQECDRLEYLLTGRDVE